MRNRALRLLRPHRRPLLAAVLALVTFAAPATAQTNLETNSGVRFNFSPPGAPNLALGGAFIGLADDATAAYTNPAGLIKIVRPEVTIESRNWQYTHVYTDRGLLDSEENRAFLDTDEGRDLVRALCKRLEFPSDCLEHGLIDAKAEDTVPALSFFSLVYPHRRWALALYRHELVNFEAHFSTFGPYLRLSRGRSPTGIPGEIDGRLASLRNRMSLDIVNNGLAAAYDLGSGFSLGATLSYYGFSLATRADRFVPDYEEAPTFDPESFVNSQTQAGDTGDWSGTLGVLWKSPRSLVSLGGVYHRGPTFDFQTTSTDTRNVASRLPPIDRRGKFHVPDAWGMGLGIRPSDAVRIAVDYDHIEYSTLAHDFIDIFGLDTLFDQDPELESFRIADADEIHVGIEYFFLGWRRAQPSLLAGAWSDPDHSLRFEGKNEGFRAMFRPRPDQVHYTLGLGFSARSVQAYLAYDYSERTRVLSLSAVHRFTWRRWERQP